MRIYLKTAAIFITCIIAFSSCHTISHLSSNHHHLHKRLTGPKFLDYPSAFSPFLLHPAATTASSSDHHYQWWDASSPELVQSGWYGFNHFSPRTARNMRGTSDRKSQTAYLLGESSHMHPHMKLQDQAIFDLLNELQRSIHRQPVPQMRQSFAQPRIIMIDQAVNLPPGVLVPVRHPRYQPHFSNHQRPQRKANGARYHQMRQSSPMPVTIKVVPLKITSADIANALKSVSFLPFPLDLANQNANAGINYDDKTSSDDEDELPPPSSHVAMPLDKDGLGIVYADSQRSERALGGFQPR